MSEATRNYTEELCRSVCKSYKSKIETLISDAGRLSKNGQILVSNYENNLDSEKDFFNQAVNDNKFFLDYSDQDLLKIAKYCYIINKNFMLGVKFDSEITKIVPDIIKQKINLEKYESGWLFLTDKNKHVTRIINNDGKNIIFLDSKGKIIKKSQFEQGLYTQFFGNNLGITKEAANELLKKAQYTWDGEKMQGGYKAFDLNGNAVDLNIIECNSANDKKTNTYTETNKKQKKNNEKYYKIPKDFQKNFSPEIMKGFEKVGNTTNCNLFLNKLTGTLDENIAKKILPNGVKSAMQMYKDWQTNENLECINPQGHFDKNRNASQKVKDAELAGNKANEFANQGYLVLAASPDFDYVTTSGTKHYTAHVSIVITQDTKYNYDAVGGDQTCFLGSNGYTGHQGRKEPEVLRDYPVFLQAGNSTGIVPPGWAFSRGLFLNDKVDYYVVKN